MSGKPQIFNADEKKQIMEFAPGKTRRELLYFCWEVLNRKDITRRKIITFTTNHPDIWYVMKKDKNKALFTPEQVQWIYENAKGKTTRELTEAVNQVFDLNITADQMRSWTKRRTELRNVMGNTRSFSNTNSQGYPIGTVRIDAYGDISIKYSNDSNDWKYLKRVVWENAHGYTDKQICHLDGNNSNCSLENLMPVSMEAKAYMVANKLWVYDDPELTKARIARAELAVTINKCKEKQNDLSSEL